MAIDGACHLLAFRRNQERDLLHPGNVGSPYVGAMRLRNHPDTLEEDPTTQCLRPTGWPVALCVMADRQADPLTEPAPAKEVAVMAVLRDKYCPKCNKVVRMTRCEVCRDGQAPGQCISACGMRGWLCPKHGKNY